jgi:methionyl-tRNA formyltransferase
MQATYDQLLKPQDGILDFGKPAARLEREIRAYAGWPRSRTVLSGKDVVVTAAHVAAADEAASGVSSGADATVTPEPGTAFKTADNRIGIVCDEGTLIIDRLQPAGKSEMDSRAFLAGNRL